MIEEESDSLGKGIKVQASYFHEYHQSGLFLKRAKVWESAYNLPLQVLITWRPDEMKMFPGTSAEYQLLRRRRFATRIDWVLAKIVYHHHVDFCNGAQEKAGVAVVMLEDFDGNAEGHS